MTKVLPDHYDTKSNNNVLLDSIYHSIHLVMLVLSRFLFAAIHSPVDIYSLFGLNPMHVFFHRSRKVLRECLVTMLGDAKRTTSAMKTEIWILRNIQIDQTFRPSTSKRLLRNIFSISPGHELMFSSACFNPLCQQTRVSGDQGLTGMMETR